VHHLFTGNDMNLTPIEKALRLVGKAQLARELGLTRAAVYSWVRKNKIPAHHVLKVEQLSGISRYDLAPEIYGVAQQS
jgi:DNA-binding transcriptional regulator YdaS (Cro superfamily)